MNTKFIKNNYGISILEVVAAIMIIALGLVGVLSLVIQNVEAQYINKNVLVASGLAQEGLELVRNVRDLNWLTTGNSWKQDIVGDDTYTIDYRGRSSINTAVNSLDDDDARLYVNDSKACVGGSNAGVNCADDSDCDSNICRLNELYTHASGSNATNFYRLITVVVDQESYLDIKCAIRWKDGTQDHDYTAETYLYNWRALLHE